MAKKTVRVTQIASTIGRDKKQGLILKAMGLGKKLQRTVELPDNASTWGMIRKLQHLVRVEN